MFKKTLARVGPSPLGFLLLGIVTTLAALGTYFAAGRSEAKAPPRAAAPHQSARHQSLRIADAAPLSPVQEFGPPPGAAGFAEVLVGTSNAFAEAHGDPARLSKAHCVEASSGHYMCAYLVSRPGRAGECHLVQAHWAEEQYSSFTIVLSGRARRCGSVREAVRSLS
jgi:hypothetical protein